MRTTYRPLRTTVGECLSIASIAIIGRSPELEASAPLENAVVYRGIQQAAAANYSAFMPERYRFSGAEYLPMNGSASYPVPADFPFTAPDASIASLSVLCGLAATLKPRSLWLEVEVRLNSPALIGGLIYGGLPFLPYYINQDGENSANFGLPRQIRVTWNQKSEFLDDQSAVTNEEPTSHSSIHILPIDPVLTDRLVLRLSGFPRFLRRVGDQQETLGLVMPVLALFSYREGSRYKPQAPVGLLGAVHQPGPPAPGYAIDPSAGSAAADFVYYTSRPSRTCFAFSAASLFGQQRTYSTGAAGVSTLKECYCTPVLAPGDRVTLFVEQSDESSRCTSGFRMRFRNLTLPAIDPRPPLEVRIYEIDPTEGVSPLDPAPLESNRYAVRLFFGEVPANAGLALECPFVRPSSMRYFAVELTNSGKQKGQVAIDFLQLVQSVQVTIYPRPSRTVTAGQLRYRLVGEQLAEDYAILGTPGFRVQVERHVAGECKEILFTANSLLELLESGARLYANHRYPEVTRDVSNETVQTKSGNDSHDTRISSRGWHRSETGQDVIWATDQNGNPVDVGGPFQSFSNAEVRTHTELIGQEGVDEIVGDLRNVVDTIVSKVPFLPPDTLPDPLPTPRLAYSDGATNWDLIWKGTTAERVGFAANLTVPPWLGWPENVLQELPDKINQLGAFLASPPGTAPLPDSPNITDLFNLLVSPASAGPVPVIPTLASVLNGLSVGASGGFSFGASASGSLSGGQILPHLNYTSTSGSTGSIAKQASNTGYAYNQTLNNVFDQSHVETTYSKGEMVRNTDRTLVSTEKRRSNGMEVMWQSRLVDIVTGAVPLGITLPATAGKMYRTTDESICVRFGAGMGSAVEMDVWFDVDEEMLRDDY